MKDQNGLRGKLWRWFFRLKQFNFSIIYKKGINNGNADALSRCPANEPDDEEDVSNHANQIVNFIRMNGGSVKSLDDNNSSIETKQQLVPEQII